MPGRRRSGPAIKLTARQRGNGNARKPVFPSTRNRTHRRTKNNDDDDDDDCDDNNYTRGDYIIFIIDKLHRFNAYVIQYIEQYICNAETDDFFFYVFAFVL